MFITTHTKELLPHFQQGAVFAYPTEAVYGLGCDPDNESAVMQLLAIKQRPVNKGLILIASDFSQVEKYLKPLNDAQQKLTHPSETTYIYPALDSAPKWLTGDFDSLAVRVSKLDIIQELCSSLNSALVSTSANLTGQEPARSFEEALAYFQHPTDKNTAIDAILNAETGDLLNPTEIRDSISGQIIRA